MKFLPYQKRWILDNSPLKLYEKTRRGGITYATSYRAVVKCLARGDGFTQWVSSRDEVTAREFITEYAAKWARLSNKSALGLDGDYIETIDEKHGLSARIVKFRNGARIVSLSSNPLAFAGKGGDVLIDEWDLHEDQAAVYDMAYPCITWGGQLELVSAYSADGSEHTEFARMCAACRNGERPAVSFHRTTILDAIEDGFVETVNEVKSLRGLPPLSRGEFLAQLRNGCRSREAFESQYLCVPNKSSGEQLIPYDDLRAACEHYEILRVHCQSDEIPDELASVPFWRVQTENKNVAFGFDIARTGDLSSLWIMETAPSAMKLIALITMKNCRFEMQKKVVRALLEASDLVCGRGDKTGLGMPLCEELEEAFPEKFAGVGFASGKLSLGVNLRAVFEKRLLKLPSDYPEIRSDLAGLRKSVSASGKLCFSEARNPLLPDSHCDLAWSAALAVHAAAECSAGSDGVFADAAEQRSPFCEKRAFDDGKRRK